MCVCVCCGDYTNYLVMCLPFISRGRPKRDDTCRQVQSTLFLISSGERSVCVCVCARVNVCLCIFFLLYICLLSKNKDIQNIQILTMKVFKNSLFDNIKLTKLSSQVSVPFPWVWFHGGALFPF